MWVGGWVGGWVWRARASPQCSPCALPPPTSVGSAASTSASFHLYLLHLCLLPTSASSPPLPHPPLLVLSNPTTLPPLSHCVLIPTSPLSHHCPIPLPACADPTSPLLSAAARPSPLREPARSSAGACPRPPCSPIMRPSPFTLTLHPSPLTPHPSPLTLHPHPNRYNGTPLV